MPRRFRSSRIERPFSTTCARMTFGRSNRSTARTRERRCWTSTPRSNKSEPRPVTEMADLPLSEIQGFVMRTYAMPAMRVFVLQVEDAVPAARFLASLVSGDPSTPQLATAVPWSVKPDYCLNIAFTHTGLAALGLPAASLTTFPEEFVEGAVARAERIGDTGLSAPEHWKGGLSGHDVHALL